MRIISPTFFALLAFSSGAIAAPLSTLGDQYRDPISRVIPVDENWSLLTSAEGRSRFQSGTGRVDGNFGKAVYLSGDGSGKELPKQLQYSVLSPGGSFATYGGLVRHVPLQAWRGNRVRITVRLKNEGNARAFVSAQINKSNATAIRTGTRMSKAHDIAWQTHSLVVDVPDNATELAIDAGLTGKGTIWLDGVTVEAVPLDAPLTWNERLPAFDDNHGIGMSYPKEIYPSLAPASIPIRPGPALSHD